MTTTDGTFESGIVGWGAASGGTFAQSSAHAHTGTFAGLLTVTGTPTQTYARATAVRVTPGSPYRLLMWGFSTATLANAMASVDFFDGAGGYISTASLTKTLVANTWTLFDTVATVTAPSNAATASYGPTIGGSPTAGKAMYVDDISFGPQVTLNVQDVYPPRVQIVVTALTVGDSISIFRQVAGVRTLVRGSTVDSVSDTAYVIVDAELPFGVPVSYVAVVEGTAEYVTAETTYDLPGGKVVLSDAITGAAAEVVIQAIGDQTETRDSTRMRVAGKNIVVTGPPGQAEGTYVLYTETWSAFENLLHLLRSSTSATVQIREPGLSVLSGQPYEGVDAYLVVDTWSWARFSQDGSDPRRMTTIQFAETDGWPSTLRAQGFTLQDLADFYGSGTLADLGGDYDTFLDLAQADLS